MSPYRESPSPEIPKLPLWRRRAVVRFAVMFVALTGAIYGAIAAGKALNEKSARDEAAYENRPCADFVINPGSWNGPYGCRPMQTLQQENGSWVCRCPKP